MSRISLKYILNALFSKSDDDFEKNHDVNVAYDAPFNSEANIIESIDEIDSNIDEINIEQLDSVRTDTVNNEICDIAEKDISEEELGQEKIDHQDEPLNHSVPNNARGDSLLDNHKCMKMIDCCLNNLSLIDEIDETTPISAVKEIIRQNCIETLITIGATPIVDEYNFNAARHIPATIGFIKPNSPMEIITPGIEIDGKTLIKAIVKQKDKSEEL